MASSDMTWRFSRPADIILIWDSQAATTLCMRKRASSSDSPQVTTPWFRRTRTLLNPRFLAIASFSVGSITMPLYSWYATSPTIAASWLTGMRPHFMAETATHGGWWIWMMAFMSGRAMWIAEWSTKPALRNNQHRFRITQLSQSIDPTETWHEGGIVAVKNHLLIEGETRRPRINNGSLHINFE